MNGLRLFDPTTHPEQWYLHLRDWDARLAGITIPDMEVGAVDGVPIAAKARQRVGAARVQAFTEEHAAGALARIQAFTDGQAAGVSALANSAFGEGYLTEARCLEMARADGDFLVAAGEGGEVAGFICFLYRSAREVEEAMRLEPGAIAMNGEPVCHAKTMAVSPELKRTGLADALFAQCLELSIQAGMRSAWGAAWNAGGRVPMRRIFEKHGFSVYGEREMLWYEDNGYRCVVCGGPCRCPAVIYYKILGGEEP